MVSANVIRKFKEEAKLSQHEIANLIHNLDALEKAGAKQKKIEKFVDKMLKKKGLMKKFIEDFTIGYKMVGLKSPK
ncbi:MAG: hypothetical protein GF329_11515 [Candidatus Lokiarchaeota archaeon]|nr:hypothetical protein [Candidatus Lokiarchaeota archaeon]